jgi:hypothetical protein
MDCFFMLVCTGSYNGGFIGGVKGVLTLADSDEDKAGIIAGVRWYKNK